MALIAAHPIAGVALVVTVYTVLGTHSKHRFPALSSKEGCKPELGVCVRYSLFLLPPPGISFMPVPLRRQHGIRQV